MWIIEATSKSGRKIYRADRKLYSPKKWTYNIAEAFRYEKESVAIQHCFYYKFGRPRIKEIEVK